MKLVLNWKLLPSWETFKVHAAGGELSTTFQLAYGPCMLQYQHIRQNVPTGAKGAQLL